MTVLNEMLWETMAGHDFEWTSLQVNVNSISAWHTDSNNVGPSCILLLGDFDGGEFVCRDCSISTNTTGTWFPFDGACRHCSLEFEGYRISVVAFQHMYAYRLKGEDKLRLIGMGFRFRLLLQEYGMQSPPLPCSTSSECAALVAACSTSSECAVRLGDCVRVAHIGSLDGSSPDVPMPAYPCTRSHPKRLIVELCTSLNSRIGQRTSSSKGCEVVRVTIDDDLTTDVGLEKALDAVRAFVGPNILVWISIPCTGGSPWQRINVAKSERARWLVEGHYRLFRALWNNVKKVATYVNKLGGYIAIEWPKLCAYWQEADVLSFVQVQGLQSVYLDGCMFGLVSKHGQSMGTPIRKPWRVDTNSPVLCQHLARVCDGSHRHAVCQGKDTKDSEGYTDELVATIHEAFEAQCILREVNTGK